MPVSPKAACRIKTCSNRAERNGLCRKHYNQEARLRPSSEEKGYNWTWRKARKRFLALHPLCVICEKEGRVKAATVVDHIERHKGDPDKFWDESNWQSLCTECHNRKTAKEVFNLNEKN